MSKAVRFLRRWRWGAVLFSLYSALSLPVRAGTTNAPSITSIQLNGANVLVNVAVPAGLTQVTLESRSRLGSGAWVPSVVTLTGGAATNIVFTLPATQQSAVLRVRGDFTAPLPASFYQGTNQVALPLSTSDPSTSSSTPGATLAPGAAGTPTTTTTTSSSTPVVESDIWEFAGNTLYFFNQRRGLQVIDISQPANPVLRFTLRLPAVGQQMYLLDTNHVVLLTQDYCGNGTTNVLLVVQITPQGPVVESQLALSGSWSDSRMVGSILYIATQNFYEPDPASGVWQWATVVSSIDFGNPAKPKLVSSRTVNGYGNLVYATDDYFFVVTQDYSNDYGYYNSLVNPFDISAGTGAMNPVPALTISGWVQNKYNLNYANGIFSAISSGPIDDNWDTWDTELVNYDVGAQNAFALVGTLRLASGSQLQSSRFDGDKAYIVTGNQTSPLYVVDNSNPAEPEIAGEVQVAGWSSFIVPLGDQLVTIGVESNLVTVSLFDVSQPARPALLSSVPLGDEYSWSFANWDDKSFNVLPDAGLILVPYEGYGTNGYSAQVQLIDLGTNSLTLRGIISHPLQPERTAFLNNTILALSDSDLLSVDATDRDDPVVTGDAELAWDVSAVIPESGFIVQVSENDPGAPTLRATTTADTATILSQLTLTNLPVLGVTGQGNYAYIAQGQSPYLFYPVPLADGSWSYPTNGYTLVLSVVDASQATNLTLMGQTLVTNASQSWGSTLTPLWVKTNVVVWAGNPQRFYPLAAAGTLTPVGVGVGVDPLPWPWWGWGGAGSLTAFDVSNPSAPQFASQTEINTNGWGFSSSYTVQNLVYTSYELSFEVTNAPAPVNPGSTTNIPPAKGGSSTNTAPPAPQTYWIEQNYLQVVDYTDPYNPTPRLPALLPGQLAGVSPDGAIVYTEGPHLNPMNYYDWTQTYLDASAYDGVSVHLIDSIAFSPNWPDAWLVDGTNVLLARSGYSSISTNTAPPDLELWSLSPAGRFVLETSLPTSQPLYSLLGLDSGLVLAQGGSATLFGFDVSQAPSMQQVLQTNLASCLWFNLSGITGSRAGGLWVPFGYYGTEEVALPP